MKVALLEPFYGGSHRQFCDGLMAFSRHEFKLFSLPDRHWKWRMSHSAVQLYAALRASGYEADLVLTNDLMDVAQLRGFMHRDGWNVPVIAYFHENQFAYPVSDHDGDAQASRDHHYRMTNYTSALAADALLFNSEWNRQSLLKGIPELLEQFPDGWDNSRLAEIDSKSRVLPLGLDLSALDVFQSEPSPGAPIVLWNHRWSFDKNPETFFHALFQLADEGIAFRLVVLGKGSRRSPEIFEEAHSRLAERILHWGWAERREDYVRWLWKADLLPITSNQDFFGISAIEAIYCRTYPLLPNRLAFNEHISDESCFFQDDSQLVALLREALTSHLSPKSSHRLEVSRYDWQHLSPRYDEILDLEVK